MIPAYRQAGNGVVSNPAPIYIEDIFILLEKWQSGRMRRSRTPHQFKFLQDIGEVPERLNGAVSKTVKGFTALLEFKSLPLREFKMGAGQNFLFSWNYTRKAPVFRLPESRGL